MIATSIEQARRLIESGLKESTADLWWVQENDFAHPYLTANPRLGRNIGMHAFRAWSLSTLWQRVHELDKTYDFPTTLSSDELLEMLVRTIVYRNTH